MTNSDDFCGYVCGPELDKIKSFADTARPLIERNPKLFKVMVGKAYDILYKLEEDGWRVEKGRKVINKT